MYVRKDYPFSAPAILFVRNDFPVDRIPHLNNGVSNSNSYTIEDIGKCNYFSIPKVDRYYFITDIVMLHGGRVAISGKVDPLMSFKTDILESTQLIVRQEKKTNNYLIDTDIPLSSKKQIIEHEFGDSIADSGYYILAVNGGN